MALVSPFACMNDGCLTVFVCSPSVDDSFFRSRPCAVLSHVTGPFFPLARDKLHSDMDATAFTKWESFYVIVGSSAAALTGLQFVVVALGAEGSHMRAQGVRAFATPTIVHFCAVLLMSAILSAPWPMPSQAALALAACGVVGFGYTLLVLRHARRQSDYAPVFEDWLWHTILPLIAYAALFASSIALLSKPAAPLFFIAGAAVLLLFIGIHNAWDAATWMAIERSRQSRTSGDGFGAVAGEQAGADAVLVDPNEEPRNKRHIDQNKHKRHRQRGR